MKNTKRSRASNGSDDQNKYFEDGKNSLIESDDRKRGNPYEDEDRNNSGNNRNEY